MLFLLFSFSICAVDRPLLYTENFMNTNFYYDSWVYEYKSGCPNNLISDGYQCVCSDPTQFYNIEMQECQATCADEGIEIFDDIRYCVNETLYNDTLLLFNSVSRIRYYDILTSADGTPQYLEDDTNFELVSNRIYQNAALCSLDKIHQKSCSFLANMCAVSMYDQNFEACRALNQIFPERNGNYNGYFDWPPDQPFLYYSDSIRNVARENYVVSRFSNNEIITFQLGQFSQDGKFKGFKELKADLQKCSIKNNRKQLWRQFGWNFYSDCKFNFSFAFDTTDFYDIFFQETYNATDSLLGTSHPVLRPIPIILQNYRNMEGIDINRVGDDTQYQLFRRFFLKDNYTTYNSTTNIFQVLSNIRFVFTIRTADKSSIQTPYVILEYTQVANTSNFLPGFSFDVQYTMEMNQFWDAVLYVFIVLILIFLAYWVIHSYIYLRQYNYGGADFHLFLHVIAELFLLLGTLLFIICLAFALFILWCYKWTKSIIMCLPPEDELNSLFYPVIWISFALLAVGIILKTILQTDLNLFLLDWEKPSKKKKEISGWRRIMIGNEWCKISTVRAYSVGFTLLIVLMIVKGFDLILTATPIPSPALIDMGLTYKIIRFAFISFIWLLLFLLQYILVNFVYWRLVSNPFLNFLEVCRVAKISCFLLITANHGYYIHGKKNSLVNADIDIETLNGNLDIEDEITLDLDDAKTFEIYLTTEFYHVLNEMYNSIKMGLKREKIVKASYETYETINSFLSKFIEKNCVHKYTISAWTRVQMIDMGPDIVDDSVFTKAPDEQFKYSMMYGMQGFLMIFYLVFFVCIDTTLYSPEIGAFIIFIVDIIIYYIFKFRTRYSLSSKGILDHRFLIR